MRYFSLAYFSIADALNFKSLENFLSSAIRLVKYSLLVWISFNSRRLSNWVKKSLWSKKSNHITKQTTDKKYLFLIKDGMRAKRLIQLAYGFEDNDTNGQMPCISMKIMDLPHSPNKSVNPLDQSVSDLLINSISFSFFSGHS